MPKEWELSFEKNIEVSRAIKRTAATAFEPFELYLRNAINALEKKENIKAKWKKIKVDNIAVLKIIGGSYEIPKRTTLKILNNKKGLYKILTKVDDPDFSEKLKFKAGKERGEVEISELIYRSALIQLPASVEKFDTVIWGYDTIELQPAWVTFQVGDIISVNGQEHKIIASGEEDITVTGIVSSTIIKNKGLDFECQILSIHKTDNDRLNIISEESNRNIVYFEKPVEIGMRIPDHKLNSFINIDNLFHKDGHSLEYQRNEGLTITLVNNNDYGKIVTSNGIRFTIENIKRNSKDAFWIQLSEMDENEIDDIPGYSPLKYFFDDDVTITDNKKNEYQIAAGIESENKITLKKKVGKEEGGKNRFYWEYCFPPDDSILLVKVNTYSLRKQLEAISTLKNMPVGEQAKLIKLFESKDKVIWPLPTNNKVTEWIVITDSARSGCLEQREFVNKALNVPNYAFLEGPPGSGKTTVILELICQLAMQNKRILLCGSTHVAIDNVLERLNEKKTREQSILERFNILPVRIGDEKRINPDIKEFQINKLINDNEIDEKLLLDVSNLVCGTTIGILQHPKFKTRKGRMEGNCRYISNEPIYPEFDYLIIDECSKTTFQEFLVPALYAKKWILVGDVMQLSPFTDREEIVSNIEQLNIDGKQLNYELQQAAFYLQKLKDCLSNVNNRFVFPVEQEVMEFLIIELIKGRMIDFKNKRICFIVKEEIEDVRNEFMVKMSIGSAIPLEMVAYDIIFIEKDLLEKNIHKLPESHVVLRSIKWTESEHAFLHNFYQLQYNFSLKERGKEINNSFDIAKQLNAYFLEKNWAEEVAWRVDREHQLRMVQKSKKKGNYSKVIEELIPKSVPKEKVEEQINQIASMAFPSILESLVKGISGRKQRFESTISEGFMEEDLKKRKITLTYQHRMHPGISKFPRERFYQSENALLDLESPTHIKDLREWSYKEYNHRSVWVNVEGKTVKNYNLKEVDVLIVHLKKFIEFAREHEQPEGKEWTVACLTFYQGQESYIREKLQHLSGNENGFSNFNLTGIKHKINIKLHTVDKFQGHEADIVFLSMVQTQKDGFMDNPNRLNVAITRAKFQLVIIGNYEYFLKKSQSEDLRELAKNTVKT
ncbi:MAG: AAA domain-containing protein [Bacteroidota bacterium]